MLLFFALACDPAPTDTGDKSSTDTADTAVEVTDDRDGDGVPDASDCDPDNENVYPGHAEIPYNGRDDDCDGFDVTDYDNDGFDGDSLEGGTDCDDNSATVNPAAVEVCYNQIDDNCDGWEGGNDCDGDGYPLGSDCDDENPLAYPDAPETWYDAVDSDCAGNDDFDQDADGESSTDFGGTDCVDTDADVFAAQDESWNGVDDDCDGTTDHLSTQSYFGRVSGDSGAGEVGFGEAIAVVPDLDGDGRRDLWVGAPGSSEGAGRVWAIGTAEGIVSSDTDGLGYLWGAELTGLGTSVLGTTLDGRDRMAVGAPAAGTEAGAVYLIETTGFPGGGQSVVEASVQTTIAFGGAGGFLSERDGRLIVGCTNGATATNVAAWTTISAGTFGLDDAAFSVSHARDACVTNGMVGDLDGDGGDELLITALGRDSEPYTAVIWSNILSFGGQYSLEDMDSFDDPTAPSQLEAAGDIDGDGLGEALFAYELADASAVADGRIYVVGGSSFVVGADLLSSAISTVSGGTDNAGLRAGNVGDLDADGQPELLIGLPGLGLAGSIPLDVSASIDSVPVGAIVVKVAFLKLGPSE